MTPPENIENLIRQFCTQKTSGLQTPPEFDERTLKNAREAQQKATAEHTTTASDLWKTLPGRNTPKLAAAALILIAALLGLYHFSLPVNIAAPAFADVMKNMLSQKWVYMFEEDRRSGHINWDCWYNPARQVVYTKNRRNSNRSICVQENTSGQVREYKDGIITIRKPDDSDFDDMAEWIRQIIPFGGVLGSYELDGADIVQREALYNSRPALLYEIRMSLPDNTVVRTDIYSWLVDKKTHLPIICEYAHQLTSTRDGNITQHVQHSHRYAFDYSDTGPTDIYDLGVPRDANVVDERPKPEIQELIDSIEQARQTTHSCYAALIVKGNEVDCLIIRDRRRVRREVFELQINRSDWESHREQHTQAMGGTFDSIYQWLGASDIISRPGISIYDGLFLYHTTDQEIEDDEPVRMTRIRSGFGNDAFSSYCWRWMPEGHIVTTPYSEQHNLICTLSGDWYTYYDPAKGYMCVRREDKEGQVHWEVAEFAQTVAGMWYPTRWNPTKTGQTRIYARDLNDHLRTQLDPQSLPNYVDHRELTQQTRPQQTQKRQDNQATEYTGFTPLHMAIYRQDIQKVKDLLKEGAEVEPAEDTGASPMELAIASGNLEMVKLIHEHGADFISNDEERRDALGLAVKEGFIDVAQFLLANGSDIEALYKRHSRPLHYAAANGDLPMVQLLLDNKAELDPTDHEGRTPLYHAIDSVAGKLGSKPIKREILQRFKDVISLLVENGADIHARRDSGQTAMSRAVSFFVDDRRNAEQQIELLKFLMERGANLEADAELRNGRSSFYRAAERKRYDIVQALLEGGIDPWLVANGRFSMTKHNLLHYARETGDTRLHNMLYPYMKERLEQTHKEILDVAGKVLRACMHRDTDAIAQLCMDHPESGREWDYWPAQIRKTYRGHEDLFDKIAPGWFTIDGLAEVYIPMPEGRKEKCAYLGFFQYPDGRWKCISYMPSRRAPDPVKGNHNSYFLQDTYTFEGLGNFLYDQTPKPERTKTQDKGQFAVDGKFGGKVILTAREDALEVDHDEMRFNRQYVLLTPECVKLYQGQDLTVYSGQYTLDQRDHPQRLVFRPQTLIVENGESVHTFTVENGQVLLTHGDQKTRADRFVLDLSIFEVTSVE